MKFKERMRSIIKPFQNHNRIKNGAIFTANIHEGRHGRKNPEWHYPHEKYSRKLACLLICKVYRKGIYIYNPVCTSHTFNNPTWAE